MSQVECWNGHPFDFGMGEDVKGIRTTCPTCGAGLKGNEDYFRRGELHVAGAMLVKLLRGDLGAFTVIENQIPADAELFDVTMREGTVRLLLRSKAFDPIKPCAPEPKLPDLVIRRADA